MTTPDLGPQPGQAVALDLRAIEAMEREPEVMGGLTVVLVGN